VLVLLPLLLLPPLLLLRRQEAAGAQQQGRVHHRAALHLLGAHGHPRLRADSDQAHRGEWPASWLAATTFCIEVPLVAVYVLTAIKLTAVRKLAAGQQPLAGHSCFELLAVTL
jgi:hypothetical protein